MPPFVPDKDIPPVSPLCHFRLQRGFRSSPPNLLDLEEVGVVLFLHQDKDTGLIRCKAGIEHITDSLNQLIELIRRLGRKRLRNLALTELLRDLDPFALAVAIRVIPI